MYRDAFDAEDGRMQSRIAEIRQLLPHAGEVGGQVESVFAEALKRALPPRIGIASGFVADSRGQISKQLDIILYDALSTPKIFSGDGVQVLPVESTYAAAEVKTRLNVREIRDSFDKCASYKQLRRSDTFRPRVLPGTIGFQETWNLYGDEVDHWESIFFVLAMDCVGIEGLRREAIDEVNRRGLNHRSKIDTICTMSGPMMINADVQNGQPQSGSISFIGRPNLAWAAYPATSPWALFLFLLLVVISQSPQVKVNIGPYFDARPF